MIDGCDRTFRESHLELPVSQNFKGLRAGDFVNQMQANKQLGLPTRQRLYGVQIPDFVEQIAFVRHGNLFDGKWCVVRGTGPQTRYALKPLEEGMRCFASTPSARSPHAVSTEAL